MWKYSKTSYFIIWCFLLSKQYIYIYIYIYIFLGCTTRRLSPRVKEHHPAWLIKGGTGNIRSAIVQHLVDSGHRINPDQAFSVYYQVPFNLPKPVKFRTLCTAEAVGIRMLKPVLCIQKQISHPLSLPWPDIHIASSYHFIRHYINLLLLSSFFVFSFFVYCFQLLKP